MTQPEMINAFRAYYAGTIYGDMPDDVAGLYLSFAADKILNRLYPFGYDPQSQFVPERYQMLQIKLAIRELARHGAEGEKAHNENGINRTYESVNDEDLLSEITPYVKVV